jgi:hypothetical protein
VLTHGGNRAGGRARRRPATAAVRGSYSGELLLDLSNKWLEGLQRVLGEVLERLDSWENKRAQGLGVEGHGGAARLWATAQRAWPASFRPLYRRVLEGGSRTPMRCRSHGMGAWYDSDVQWFTAGGLVDGRWHGRLGLAMARAVRGARGVGKEGGAAPGGPTARGPADQGRPRQACTAGGNGSTRHSSSTSRALAFQGKMFRTSPVQLRFSQDF